MSEYLNPYPPAAWQTAPFTDAEYGDIVRFAGYGTLDGYGFLFGGTPLANLVFICSQMTPARQATMRTVFLANLTALEQAVLDAGANLDTDQAAVWTHNKDEVSDRTSLFNQHRRSMCAFIGIPAGDALTAGSRVIRG